MKIIDFHTHYLPECVPESVILEHMDDLGIEKSVVLATPDHPRYTELKLTGTNEKVLELCNRHPDRFISGFFIDPRNIMESQTAIRRYYDNGGRFLKMWPGHGWAPDDPMIYPVWEVINELKMGVILHMGMLGVRNGSLSEKILRSTGFNAKYGQPVLLDAPARIFPDIQFVIAHTAYPWSLEAFTMAKMFSNLWIDFSCGLGYEGWNLIEKLQPGYLPWDKFLFASDTAGTADSFVKRWSEISKHELFAPYAEDFFYNNARRLIQKVTAQ